jgi:hypothetical protein
MSIVDGLGGKNSEGRIVTVASTTSIDASTAERFVLVTFDLSYPVTE